MIVLGLWDEITQSRIFGDFGWILYGICTLLTTYIMLDSPKTQFEFKNHPYLSYAWKVAFVYGLGFILGVIISILLILILL